MTRITPFPKGYAMSTIRLTVLALVPALALAAWAPAVHAAEDDPYAALVTYEQAAGMSRKPLTTIENAIRAASDAERQTIERKLLGALANPQATYGCKQFVCRMLRRIGTEPCVPALSALLGDAKLSHMARFALQSLPTPKAGEALRTALRQTAGDRRIGIIASLGFRRDAQAVAPLATLAASPDQATASAAITALGQIATTDAVAALQKVTPPQALAIRHADALLACADTMALTGNKPPAAAVYRQMAGEGNPTFVRVAAFRGLVLTEGEKAIPTILPLVRSNVPALQQAVGKYIAEMPGAGVGPALAKQVPGLPDGAKLIVLGALEQRGDKAAAPTAAAALASQNADVRTAAARALATLGGAAHVEPLLQAATAGGEAGNAAADALTRLSGDGVAEAVVKQLDASDAAVRAMAIEVVTARKGAQALPAALKATGDPEAPVRMAAYKALGAMAGPKELPTLVDLLVAAKANNERQTLQRTTALAAERTGDASDAVLVGALGKASPEAKAALMTILAQTGGPAALEAVKGQLAGGDADLRKAAVRTLADWHTAAPAPALLEIARTDPSATNQVLALRGYVRMLTAPEASRPDAETVRMLGQALAAAKRPEEKRMILGALPPVACPQALTLAESLQRDPALAAEAKQALGKIRSALVSTKIKVTASSNAGAARSALDGKSSTRWDSSHPMRSGDWFAMDFQMPVTVKSIFLDHRPSGNDWPRSYEVYVSDDGKNWGRPVVTGKGDTKGTTIRFPKTVKTQHVKIVQTGKTDKWYWSIHQMKVEVE